MHRDGEGILNIELHASLPGGTSLVEDYLALKEAALRFYAGSYRKPESYRTKAGEVSARFEREERERAASLVRTPTVGARSRLERLVEEDGFFVSAGQQPGLFTGPLYTIYKALASVQLARVLEEELERPVMPLFWIASEDHDWQEVNHVHLVDLHNELRRVGLSDREEEPELPIHRISPGEALQSAIEEISQILPETDFSEDYLKLIHEHADPHRPLSDAFYGILSSLLSPWDLVYVDAAEARLKEESLPVLRKELGRAGAHEDLLRTAAGELEAEGYPVQVPVLEGAVNLFLEGPEGRERIYRDDGRFRLRRSGKVLGREEILSRAGNDPRVLSPNVFLRPVVENYLFPVVATVAGPGELGYYAQLASFFESHGLRMPVVHPRPSVTVVEAKNRKVLEKFGLEIRDLSRPFHELAAELTREEIPPEVVRALGELRGAVGEKSGRLMDVATEIDPTLKGPITGARNTAFSELDEVERKIVQALKRENEVALEQLKKAQVHLFPLAEPQERVLNVFYYLVRYGDDFLPAVLERVDVALDGGSP